MRAVSNYTLYDDPIRLLRLLRFKVRLGFTIEERTKMQYDNAREAQLETRIAPEDLLEELRHIANEPNCADIIKLLEEEKLLQLVLAGFGRRQAESPGLAEAAEGAATGPVRHRYSSGEHGLVPVLPDREAARQRSRGVYQEHRVEPAGSGPVAEAGGESQEAGKGLEVGQAAEALEGLSGAFRGVRAIRFCSCWRIPPNAWCTTASRIICGNTCRPRRKSPIAMSLATGVQAGYAEVPEGARGSDSDASWMRVPRRFRRRRRCPARSWRARSRAGAGDGTEVHVSGRAALAAPGTRANGAGVKQS